MCNEGKEVLVTVISLRKKEGCLCSRNVLSKTSEEVGLVCLTEGEELCCDPKGEGRGKNWEGEQVTVSAKGQGLGSLLRWVMSTVLVKVTDMWHHCPLLRHSWEGVSQVCLVHEISANVDYLGDLEGLCVSVGSGPRKDTAPSLAFLGQGI